MISDKRELATFESESDIQLLPPRFDEHTSASARPVERLPESRLRTSIRKLASVATGGTNAKALVLFVVLGLATGTLAGVALVKRNKPVEPAVSETVFDISGTNQRHDEMPVGAVMGVADFPRMRTRGSRLPVWRTQRNPKAYRVAVIR
jgi:hypothetical protein